MSEFNIIEDIVGADIPKVVDDEQLLVYMAMADYLNKGAASFNMKDFIVDEGYVSIRGGSIAEVNKISSISTIYNDVSELPTDRDTVKNGTILVAKSDGFKPYILYEYNRNENLWSYKDEVREGVIYYVLSTTYDEDVLYRWRDAESAFYPLNVITPQTFITDVGKIYNNLGELRNAGLSPLNGDTVPVLTNGNLPGVIYIYQSGTDEWKFRDILNPQNLYLNINPASNIGAGCILKWVPGIKNFQVLYDPTHPEELPPITSADNDKILQVSNGKWVAKKLPVYKGDADLLPDYAEWSGGTY